MFFVVVVNANVANAQIMNDKFEELAYHGIIFQVSGEGNRVPKILQSGMVGLNWT